MCFTLYLQFEEYNKMMYLDIQVFENIDHLFDTPDGYFYAVMDCFCEKTWSQQFPEKVTWPVDQMGSPPPPLYFNAGMFVFEPNRLTYENLHEVLKSLHLRCLQSK
jgi:inositol 3-alpha-galactosyltransferase